MLLDQMRSLAAAVLCALLLVTIGCLSPLTSPHREYKDPWKNPNWYIGTVDNNGSRDQSITLGESGNPRISYSNNMTGATYLKYAYNDGNHWVIEIVEAIGSNSPSIKLDSFGRPCIAYGSSDGEAVKFALKDGDAWRIETVGECYAHVPISVSLALDGSDTPHISYVDYLKQQLKYAVHEGGTWHIDTVTSSEVDNPTAIAVDSKDNPCISYVSESGEGIKTAIWNGSHWEKSTIDRDASECRYNDIAVDPNDIIYVAYSCSKGLKIATCLAFGWEVETIDDKSIDEVSIALDSSGDPHILYVEDSYNGGALKYAWRDNSKWNTEVIYTEDERRVYVMDPSIAVSPPGLPYVTYYNYREGSLKYAYRLTPPR
ncbi:MAG: hypothetical protein JSW52_09415 [Candidatus Coatesbacteria bacterium]|nr:MAG: hypothetical protein JSW52_09415 [Candidatus Coatesbacteria bacterium]